MSVHDLHALRPGAVFQGRYEIVRCINAGGMGAVYEAIHLETKRRRALKVMLPSVLANETMRERFKLEATVAAGIESEHIVETLDAGVDEATGTPFLVMELLRGEDLGALLARKKVSAEDAVLFLFQAALALDKTHAAGIVHRDLKPENLFVTYRDDGSPKVKLLDFGIAKVIAQSGEAARRTHSVGTPLYMAPEQVRGDRALQPFADLHALGQIAYTVLAGEAYWEEESLASESILGLLTSILDGVVEPPVARALRRTGAVLPPAFDPWFLKATAREDNDRFPRASEMVSELAKVLGVALPRMSRAVVRTEPPPPMPGPAVIGGSAPAEGLANPSAIAMTGSSAQMDPALTAGALSTEKRASVSSASHSKRILAGAGVVGAMAIVVLGMKLGRPRAPGDPSTSVAKQVEAASPSALPSATMPSSVTPPIVDTPAPAVPSTTPTSKAPIPHALPQRPTPRTSASAKAGPVAPSANCSPAYTVDADGNKHFKVECL